MLSAERLAPYLDREPVLADALNLYERNSLLAAQLWSAIGLLEVAFRNQVDHALCARAVARGEGEWLSSRNQMLRSEARESIEAAEAEVLKRHPPARGRTISVLSLGFWMRVLREPRLWSGNGEGVVNAFPSGPRDQKQVVRVFNQVRDTRNRIAHHEPVWRDGRLRYVQIRQAASFIGPELHDWINATTRVPEPWKVTALPAPRR